MKKLTEGNLNINFFSNLVCPLSRTPLKLTENKSELVSEAAALAFPIRDGVPILLLDEARRID